jgi:Circadian oscillating protein COP23
VLEKVAMLTKYKVFGLLFTPFLISLGLVTSLNQPGQAQGGDQFLCVREQGIPTTKFQTPNGSDPMIRWTSTRWGRWTPEARCQEVSKQFQIALDQGRLEHITYGSSNGYNIICAAQTAGGACVQQIFTLAPGDDPNEVMAQIRDIIDGLSSAALEQQRPLLSWYNGRPYINFRVYRDLVNRN